MMMEDTQDMSQDKLDQLKAEYSDLKLEKISAIAKRIDEARQLGDLSENAEYHAARDEMAWAQSRVKELEHIIDSAEIVANTGSKIIQIGSSIRVKANKVEKEYTIVGAQEANPLAGKISNESPIGSAFLGKSKGDKVQVRLPAGVQEYKILDVK